MEKTFTVAGTSNLNGVVKFRFANDLKSRIKVLEKNGHTAVMLLELPTAMTKADAIAYLESLDAEPTREEDEALLALLELGAAEYDDAADVIVPAMDSRMDPALEPVF